MLIAFAQGIRTQEAVWWWFVPLSFTGFVILMNLHSRAGKRLRFVTILQRINAQESAFLEKNELPFHDGASFTDPSHVYSYDLDIFGPKSLYQHLNRTHTVMGRQQLAHDLLFRLPDEKITERQLQLSELSELTDWRHSFQSRAEMADDSGKIVDAFLRWTSDATRTISPVKNVFLWLFPALGCSLTIAGILFGFQGWLLHLPVTVFIVNLLILGSEIKNMNREITHADKIHETVLRYAELLRMTEEHAWKSAGMQKLSAKLTSEKNPASASLHRLSRIFVSLESLQNGFGAILFNGTLLFHVHTYRKLLQWKRLHAHQLEDWLQLIGELEVLVSLSNFAFNNPKYAFPETNTGKEFAFISLGHPLLNPQKRITNDISFTRQSFVILTGSNMSGKSTFLRTLGINLVLANCGAPVCAASTTFHPMDILVSMRLSDSLSDSESYFFAEVKRLKMIMEKLGQQPCFVLLDEILRGTNSDDKRSGTVGVIKKLAERTAIGVIATHDLEVCLTTNDYPKVLVNKCFEVEIMEDELHFDYRLRDGVCRNKSATFLMKKTGII